MIWERNALGKVLLTRISWIILNFIVLHPQLQGSRTGHVKQDPQPLLLRLLF